MFNWNSTYRLIYFNTTSLSMGPYPNVITGAPIQRGDEIIDVVSLSTSIISSSPNWLVIPGNINNCFRQNILLNGQLVQIACPSGAPTSVSTSTVISVQLLLFIYRGLFW
jgi:hypothetical protein